MSISISQIPNDLSKLYTQQLINIKNMYSTWSNYCDPYYWQYMESLSLKEAEDKAEHYSNLLQKIMNELSTREHIPNKEERKKIRQAKAKAKKHR